MLTVKTLGHAGSVNGSAISKLAYIDREKYDSTYDCHTYNFSRMNKDDLVYTSSLFVDGMEYKDFGEMLNDIENSKITIRKDATIVRDWMFSLDNRLIVRDDNNKVDITATTLMLKKDLDDFFKEHFVDNGYAVHYAVHFPDKNKNGNENFHIHVLTTCNQFDSNKHCWLNKSYRDEEGKKVNINDLDDKARSKDMLKKFEKISQCSKTRNCMNLVIAAKKIKSNTNHISSVALISYLITI